MVGKIKTWKFFYDGKDNFGSIEFCAITVNAAERLFVEWCKENGYDTLYNSAEAVWNSVDASEEELYWSKKQALKEGVLFE